MLTSHFSISPLALLAHRQGAASTKAAFCGVASSIFSKAELTCWMPSLWLETSLRRAGSIPIAKLDPVFFNYAQRECVRLDLWEHFSLRPLRLRELIWFVKLFKFLCRCCKSCAFFECLAYLRCSVAQAKLAQANKNATPPIGVMAPSPRMPE